MIHFCTLQNYTCSLAEAPPLQTSLFAEVNAFWVARQISPQGLWSNPVNLPTSCFNPTLRYSLSAVYQRRRAAQWSDILEEVQSVTLYVAVLFKCVSAGPGWVVLEVISKVITQCHAERWDTPDRPAKPKPPVQGDWQRLKLMRSLSSSRRCKAKVEPKRGAFM